MTKELIEVIDDSEGHTSIGAPLKIIHAPTKRIFELVQIHHTVECETPLIEYVAEDDGERLIRLPTDFKYFERVR